MCVFSCFNRIRHFATPWTVARQAPLSMGFSRQEYWSGLPWSPPGDLPDPGIESQSLMSPAWTGGFFTARATWRSLSLKSLYSIIWWSKQHQALKEDSQPGETLPPPPWDIWWYPDAFCCFQWERALLDRDQEGCQATCNAQDRLLYCKNLAQNVSSFTAWAWGPRMENLKRLSREVMWVEGKEWRWKEGGDGSGEQSPNVWYRNVLAVSKYLCHVLCIYKIQSCRDHAKCHGQYTNFSGPKFKHFFKLKWSQFKL